MSRRRLGLDDFAKDTPSIERAEAWLQDGKRNIGFARRELGGDHAESVAHSSKSIEFSAKSLLTLAGVRFKPWHEIGIGLERVWRSLHGKDVASVGKAKRQIARVGWLCDVVAPLQNISEYGFAGKSPTLLVNETDAATFFRYGEEALDICQRILGRVKDGSFKFE